MQAPTELTARDLQALIFDVDGTLADTEEIHRQAFNVTFPRFGLDWHWTRELYAELLGISGGRERITHYAASVSPVLLESPDFPSFVRTLHQAKTAHYAGLLQDGRVRLRNGVERLLHEARATGLRLALATSSAWSNLKTLLDGNLPREWPTWFSAIETADSVEAKKPSPAVYDAVLRRLRLPAAGCLAFEDTENGLASARAAGIGTIITAHAFTRTAHFEGALAVLDGLGEPEHPMTVLRGPACAHGFVDLEYLSVLRRAAHLHVDAAQHELSFV
ncbi:MAG: HAD-IA family hydrolase [Gammaproteobacteria bacterium]